jgi:hypothetical protein
MSVVNLRQPASAVYKAMTVDYGTSRRESEGPFVPTMLDFDGFLHVKDVEPFVLALIEWQAAVQGSRRVRRTITLLASPDAEASQ